MSGDGERSGPLRVSNEFAFVDVEVRRTHGGTVLHIRDLQTGADIELDALELEALTRLRHADLGRIVDPSFEGFDPVVEVERNGDGVAVDAADAAAGGGA